jgi:hypothetical protein
VGSQKAATAAAAARGSAISTPTTGERGLESSRRSSCGAWGDVARKWTPKLSTNKKRDAATRESLNSGPPVTTSTSSLNPVGLTDNLTT